VARTFLPVKLPGPLRGVEDETLLFSTHVQQAKHPASHMSRWQISLQPQHGYLKRTTISTKNSLRLRHLREWGTSYSHTRVRPTDDQYAKWIDKAAKPWQPFQNLQASRNGMVLVHALCHPADRQTKDMMCPKKDMRLDPLSAKCKA
jgi:hypothetical protein